MLKLENISLTFNKGTINERNVINNLSLEVKEGDFITIIGSNGAGKSTLFNLIAGTYLSDSGTIPEEAAVLNAAAIVVNTTANNFFINNPSFTIYDY